MRTRPAPCPTCFTVPSCPTAVGLRVMNPPNINVKAIGISRNGTTRSAGVGIHRKSACDARL